MEALSAKIDMILWIMSGGFTFMLSLMLIMWTSLNKRIDGVEDNLGKRIDGVESTLGKRIDDVEESLGRRIDKLDEKLTDVDRRLCRMEGAFTSKDWCVLKDERTIKKAE